ncbi:MAG: ribonuclease H-like domain-containing protein [Nitrospiraceae bacterium]|nr:ribonuclease H-like domain-containing protein [Nitrospiraceae bacterium]
MSRVIFDIETAGSDLDALGGPFKDYFLRFAQSEDELEAVKDSLSFYPLTAEIVAIGMLNPDSGRGAVYYQAADGPEAKTFEEDGIVFEAGAEKEILEKFWRAIRSYDQFVTFNGRCFDCPFILTRSALHRTSPTRDLMPNRYCTAHIDLLDQLTFFGAVRRRFSLDLWCRFLGIESPKKETTGHEVKDLFRAGRRLDIARYCAGDLRATKSLLDYWQNYMRFAPGEKR